MPAENDSEEPTHRLRTGAAIERGVLEDLRDSVGEDADEFLADLIDTFLEQAPALLDILRDTLANEDVDGFARAAHTLKSNAATFGAATLSDLCREMEALAKAGTLDEASRLEAQAESEYGRVRVALQAIRRELPS